MGPAGFHDCPWTAILLSASLLTTWNPLAAAQFTDHAELLSNTQMERASLAKPILTVRQRVVTEQRDMADFYCATNAVNATIHWVFNNSPLVLNERMKLSADNKNLTVLVVQREDSGSYLCEVQSGFEVGRSDDTLLEVNYGPDPVSIKLDSGVATGDVVEVMEGNTVNFWVETQSYPAPTYTWYLPTDSIQPPPITGQLTIPAISREQEGMYRCLVSNTVTNSSRLGVVKVQVLDGPDQVDITQGSASGVVNTIEATLNSSLTLHCWADSKPGARYHWTHEHSSQVFAGDQLNIEALRQEHQGIYSCTSSNNVTGLTRSASVLVTVVGLQSSSMSPGVIAGIVIGILAAIALVIGLGYFLYSTKDRWIHRRSANDTTTSNTEPPTSVTQSTPESTRPNKPKPVYDNMLKPKGEDRGKKMPSPPPVSPEHFYEKKPPSAAPEGPRKPLPRIPKQPLVPPVPNRNKESNYEALLNPNQSLYCKINPSV